MPETNRTRTAHLQLLAVSWNFGWPIAAGVALGYWIDENLGSSPAATLIIGIGALAASTWRLVTLSRLEQQAHRAEEEDAHRAVVQQARRAAVEGDAHRAESGDRNMHAIQSPAGSTGGEGRPPSDRSQRWDEETEQWTDDWDDEDPDGGTR
jgi:hypothetical protein